METSPEVSRRSASLFAVPVAWPFQEKPEKPEKPTCIGVPRRGFKQDLKVFFVSKANVNLLHQKGGKNSFLERSFSAPQISKKTQFIQGFPYTNPVKCQNIFGFFFLEKIYGLQWLQKEGVRIWTTKQRRTEGFWSVESIPRKELHSGVRAEKSPVQSHLNHTEIPNIYINLNLEWCHSLKSGRTGSYAHHRTKTTSHEIRVRSCNSKLGFSSSYV